MHVKGVKKGVIHTSNAIYVGGVKGYFDLQHLLHASTYIAFDGMVQKP